MKLWDKGKDVQKEVEAYTVGSDYKLDLALLPFDCLASIAHAKGLVAAKVLTPEEGDRLIEGLEAIAALHAKGDFCITQEDEDCHTAIENHLTAALGDLGKKIHTGRSRNDQVAVALRLYMIEMLGKVKKGIAGLQQALEKEDVPMPGYTHMQKAMPSSTALWLGSFAAALEDDKILIDSVLKALDQNPLGSGAGFGIPVFDLDRELTAKELGFSKVQENPMYVQLSRGKFESLVIGALSAVAFTLNKLATDLMLFSMPEFGYVSLPEDVCTGSSIMPQKKNPDVLELMRANYHVVVGNEMKVKGIMGNLMSGYNRDLQLTKQPLMESCDIVLASLKMATLVMQGLTINKEACKKAMTKELHATEEAYKLVKDKGIPFRDAYKEISKKFID